MDESLEPIIWRKISNFISKNSGVEASKIAEALDIKISQLECYLSFMEEIGEIYITPEGNHKKCYITKRKKGSPDRRGQEIQIKIRNIVAKNPGIHLSKVATILQISSPLAKYHLQNMEKTNLIISSRDENKYYKRYYIKYDDIGVQHKKILSLLRQQHLFKIVSLLITHENLTHKELMKKLEIAPSTLSYHLNRLIEQEIIDAFYHGKEKGYRLKNRDEIVGIVRKYTLGKSIESFSDIWRDFNLK